MEGKNMKIEREKKFLRQQWRDGKLMDEESKQRIKEKRAEGKCRRICKKEKERRKIVMDEETKEGMSEKVARQRGGVEKRMDRERRRQEIEREDKREEKT